MKTALIYFGNQLDLDAFHDDGQRIQALERGIRAISAVEGFEIVRRLPSSCAVAVEAPDDVIQRLRDLTADGCLGSLTVSEPDRPMFRAAH